MIKIKKCKNVTLEVAFIGKVGCPPNKASIVCPCVISTFLTFSHLSRSKSLKSPVADSLLSLLSEEQILSNLKTFCFMNGGSSFFFEVKRSHTVFVYLGMEWIFRNFGPAKSAI